jgi:hypothetical protein
LPYPANLHFKNIATSQLANLNKRMRSEAKK